MLELLQELPVECSVIERSKAYSCSKMFIITVSDH